LESENKANYMKTISATEAHKHFYQILDQVEQGETIIVQRRGKPIARLVPPPPKVRKGFPNLSKFRASIKVKGKPLSQEASDARDEERY
jgi:prevent-host-death family protein